MEKSQEIDLCIYENLIFDKNGILNYCPMVLEQLGMPRKQSLIAISHLLQKCIPDESKIS